jgi:S-DNA-T family DNA segregation ATPase FtsK/SpoIIIE
MGFLGGLFGRPDKKSKGKGKKAKGSARSGKPDVKNAPRPKGPPPAPEPEPPPPGMSLDRKLDIVGVVLIFVGLLSLFSLFSSDQTAVMKAWLNMLSQVAGWGRFGLPIGFIIVGGWIVLRKFGDKMPRVEFERLAGLILLYLALLVSLHFIAAPDDAAIYPAARLGEGGGYVGAFILATLFGAFGQLGSVVLLAAWWLLAIVFTLGLSVPEIVLLISNGVRRLRGPAATATQLPLPTRSAPPSVQPARPAPSAPPPTTTKPATPAPRATAPAASKSPAAAAAAPVPPIDILPPAGNIPAPSYDQPLVIGGEQVWELPKVEDVLESGMEAGADDEFDRKRVKIIEETLASFGAPVKVVEVNRGPTITQFGVEPGVIEQRGGKTTKVKVGKIAALADDLALALSAHSIRIEAPVPGKGYVGIEVPNEQTSIVALRDVMEAEPFLSIKGTLALALGQDVSGTAIAANLANMPHLLIAGTTGSGKSVCVNGVIAALLIQNTPDDLKILMVDPKRVELTGYNGVPHLIMPVVVELERVVASLQWVTREMDERYRKFAKTGVRNINDYNEHVAAGTITERKLPYLIVIIDELADLMMLAPDETERILTRLAQLARATGIHLIIATQRPSVDVVTGLIKANFPARIAFAVASSVDSRVILDQPGAERLLGRGDMLFQSPDSASPLRMQGTFVSDAELQRLVRYWKGARGFDAVNMEPSATAAPAPAPAPSTDHIVAVGHGVPLRPEQRPFPELGSYVEPLGRTEGEDELLEEAIRAVREMKKASISLLQRRLRIGYTRAARLIDVLEEKGIIGPAKAGAQQREVIGADALPEDLPPQDDDQRMWSAEQ